MHPAECIAIACYTKEQYLASCTIATPALWACSLCRLLVAAPSRPCPTCSFWRLDCNCSAVAAQLGYICVDTFLSAVHASSKISKAESSSVDMMK